MFRSHVALKRCSSAAVSSTAARNLHYAGSVRATSLAGSINITGNASRASALTATRSFGIMDSVTDRLKGVGNSIKGVGEAKI
jgi:hypothetical protein